MKLDENLETLLFFIEEGLRIKIFLKYYLSFIKDSYEELNTYNLNDISSIRNFLNICSETYIDLYLNFNRNFKDDFDKFLISNPIIDKFMNEVNIPPSIVITDFKYQIDFIEEFCSNRENFKDFKIRLEKFFEGIETEIIHLSDFRDELLFQLEKSGECHICRRRTLYRCKSCKKYTCSSDFFFETHICLNCSKINIKKMDRENS